MAPTDAISSALSGFQVPGLTSTITYLVIVLIIVILSGTIAFFVLTAMQYNRKIVIFENLSGQGYVPTGRDRAKLLKIGDSGEEILRLRKRKLHRQAYGKKIGKNTYAFAIGQDGYWYNVSFGDLDQQLRELKINPVDRDMRYMHVAIRRNVAHRFDQPTFLQKYGGILAYTILILITGIMMWLLFDQYLEILGSVEGAINAANDVLETTKGLLQANDNIASGGSGLVAA